MKRRDLDAKFTRLVCRYLNKGYSINTNSFAGGNGTIRIDFIKGMNFIRVMIDPHRRLDLNELGGWEHAVALSVVGKTLTKNEAARISVNPLVINDKDMVVINEEEYFTIGTDDWLVTRDELPEIRKIQNDRRKAQCGSDLWFANGYSNKVIDFTSDRAKQIALRYIKKQPRCKTATLSDIRVQKVIFHNKVVFYAFKGRTSFILK